MECKSRQNCVTLKHLEIKGNIGFLKFKLYQKLAKYKKRKKS